MRMSALALIAAAALAPTMAAAQMTAGHLGWLQDRGYGRCQELNRNTRQCVGSTLADPKSWTRLTLLMPDGTGTLKQRYSKVVLQERGKGQWDQNERFGIARDGQVIVAPTWREIVPLGVDRVLATADVIPARATVDNRAWNIIDLATGAVTPAPNVLQPKAGYSETHLFVTGANKAWQLERVAIGPDGGTSLPMKNRSGAFYQIAFHGDLIVTYTGMASAGRDAANVSVFDRHGAPVLVDQELAYNPTYKRLAVVSGPAPGVTGASSPVWTLLDGDGRPAVQPYPNAIGMVTLNADASMMLMGGRADLAFTSRPIVPVLGVFKVGDGLQYGAAFGPEYDLIEMRPDPATAGRSIPVARWAKDKQWRFFDPVATWQTVYSADEAFAQGLAARDQAWKNFAAQARTPEGLRNIRIEQFKQALVAANAAPKTTPTGLNPRQFNAWAAPFRAVQKLGAELGGAYAEQASRFPVLDGALVTAVCRDAAHACADARASHASTRAIEAQTMSAPALTAAQQQSAYMNALNQNRSVLGSDFIDQVMRNNEAQRAGNCAAAYTGANRICYPR